MEATSPPPPTCMTPPPHPHLLELFCGHGGWSRAALELGWQCTGIDNVDQPTYPGHFIKQSLPGKLPPHDLIIASPPCRDFARHHLPWIRGPVPSTELLEWSINTADVTDCSIFASRHTRHPGTRVGSYVLWGDVPPLIIAPPRTKMKISGRRPDLRALIHPMLAHQVLAWLSRRSP
jgi:hypothetical protein